VPFFDLGVHHAGRQVRGDRDDLGGPPPVGSASIDLGFMSTIGSDRPGRRPRCVPPRISLRARVGLRTSVALLINAEPVLAWSRPAMSRPA
jgi:hypothetical protein